MLNLIGGRISNGFRSKIVLRYFSLFVTIILLTGAFTLPISAEGEKIDVYTPNGGESLIAGSNVYLRWNVSSSGGYISIFYTDSNEGSYQRIATISNNPIHGISLYRWFIPPNINSSYCLIKVVWQSSISRPYTVYDEDVSDSYFTIEPGTVMNITKYPNRVSYGRYYSLEWDLFDPHDMVAGLVMDWKVDDGSGWSPWGSLSPFFDWYDPSRGYMWWTIPDYIQSGHGRIRIRAMSDGNTTVLNETSTDNFEIVSPGITLIKPDGGVTLVAGSTYTIEWRTSKDPEKTITGASLDYTTNGGFTWNTIIASTTNDFQFVWTVPSITTPSLIVRVTSQWGEFNTLDTDQSTGTNSIISSSDVPSITLLDPNPPVDGGIVMGSNETYRIKWSLTGYSSITGLTLEYSTDNGSTYNLIVYYLDGWANPHDWKVPSVDTYEAKIKVTVTASGYPDRIAVSNHPFYIFDTVEFNRPPVALAGSDRTVDEGIEIFLNGQSSYDPDGDLITYNWTQISPSDITANLNNRHWANPHFMVDLDNYPVTFVFELEVSDGIEHEGVLLYNLDRVSITVNPKEPELTSVEPKVAWRGTKIKIKGSELKGAEVIMNGVTVAQISTTPYPDNPNPDKEYTFTLLDILPNGTHDITIKNSRGEDSIKDAIEVYPEPIWQYENGIGFRNLGTKSYSYPWKFWTDGHYKDVFGDQIYLTAWVCIGLPVWTPWSGWDCAGYEIEEPFAPNPLAAVFYGLVFEDIGEKGECFGMSTTALEHYHGVLESDDFAYHTDWEDLQRSGDFHRHIQNKQGSQMSAEVLGKFFYTLVNGLMPSTQYTGMGPWVNDMKSLIDSGELGIATMICDHGAHAVVPYAYEDRGDKTYFYVYDSNREEFSHEDTAPNQAQSSDEHRNNPPALVIDRSGLYWTWSFEWQDGTIWSDELGLGMVDYSTLVGDRTLPTTLEGVFDILTGSATISIEDQDGARSGIDETGEIQWEIPDAAPLPIFGGAGYKPNGYYLPRGNYTTHISGTEAGKYDWTVINNGSSAFTIEDADVNIGSKDTISTIYADGNPYRGELIFGTEDDLKTYNSSIIHSYGPRNRIFKVIGAELNRDEEHGDGLHLISATGDYNGLIFENMGGGRTTFDVEFSTNVMSEEVWNGTEPPGPGSIPTAVREGITVEPGEILIVSPSDWTDLNNSEVIIEGETAPGAPLNLMAIENDGTVELRWDPPDYDGGLTIIEYQVFRGNETDDKEMIAAMNETNFIDDSVVEGRTYYYQVRALYDTGPGELSEEVSIYLTIQETSIPSFPRNLVLSESEEGVLLTWDPPEGEVEIEGYLIIRSSSTEDALQIADLPPDVFEYIDTSVEPGRIYFYVVVAYNENGQGPPTDELSMETSSGQEPSDDEKELDDDDRDTGGDDDGENGSPWLPFVLIGLVLIGLLILVAYILGRRSTKGDISEE